MTSLHFYDLAASQFTHHLMAQADTQHWNAGFLQFCQSFQFFAQVCVAGPTTTYNDAVWFMGENLLRTHYRWNNNGGKTSCVKRSDHIITSTQIDHNCFFIADRVDLHFSFRFPVRSFSLISLDCFKQLCLVVIGHFLGSNQRIHNTVVTQFSGQCTGIHAEKTSNAFALHPFVDTTGHTVVGWSWAPVTNDNSRNMAYRQIIHIFYNTIVAQHREGVYQKVVFIGRIGQQLLETYYRSIEHQFAISIFFGADAVTLYQSTVLQQKPGFLCIFINVHVDFPFFQYL